MNDTAPCRQQHDRDALDDYGVTSDWPDYVGSGPHAQHAEELMPS